LKSVIIEKKTLIMIRFENVSKTFGDQTVALNKISFEVPKGQFCVLLGHSGAGKSTLLRMVNGLLEPSSGAIFVDGTEVNETSVKVIRRKVSMIYQEYNLSRRSSVAVNVMAGALVNVPLWMALVGWFPKEIRRKCCALVQRVGLEEKHLKRRVRELSGGQQQRVGIARSMMLDPIVILADEPIASLDPSTSRGILSQLQSIAREANCTILCCLHQVELAREFADRIIGIESGRIVFDLLPTEVNDETLNLIYDNYEITDDNTIIAKADVSNILNVSAEVL